MLGFCKSGHIQCDICLCCLPIYQQFVYFLYLGKVLLQYLLLNAFQQAFKFKLFQPNKCKRHNLLHQTIKVQIAYTDIARFYSLRIYLYFIYIYTCVPEYLLVIRAISTSYINCSKRDHCLTVDSFSDEFCSCCMKFPFIHHWFCFVFQQLMEK